MNHSALQKKFNDAILLKFDRQAEAVTAMARILQMQPDSIYRRLRGQTPYRPSEMARLARAFEISIDDLIFERSDQVLFTFSLFSRQVDNVEDYLNDIFQRAIRIRKLPEISILYTTQEIPVFLYYYFPKLFKFKMYVYSLNYWHLPDVKEQKFHFELFPERASKTARDIARIYMELDSTELWSQHILDHTLNQITYFLMTDRFENPEDALQLCEVLRNFLDHCKKMSERGQKLYRKDGHTVTGGTYELYINEFASTNDTILIRTPAGPFLFTSFGSANFLRTENERLCRQVSDWLKMIITRSTMISKNTAKHRHLFFNQLEKRIDRTVRDIRKIMNL